MLAATVIGVILVPAMYVLVQGFGKRKSATTIPAPVDSERS
jgi:hypothetical protein